jgi:hypothetical protein
MRRRLPRTLGAAVIMAICAAWAFGQGGGNAATVPTVKSGTLELSGFVGGTFDLPGAATSVGLCQTGTTNCILKYEPGTKVMFAPGGGFALNIYKALWLYGDYSVMKADRSAASVTVPPNWPANIPRATDSASTVRKYQSAVGGFQVALPSVQRFSPYFELGGGYLFHHYNYYDVVTNFPGTFDYNESTNCKPGADCVPVTNGFAMAHLGGGVRYFKGERWGFKVSIGGYRTFKGIRQAVPTGDSRFGSVSVDRSGWGNVTVGVFKRFGRH